MAEPFIGEIRIFAFNKIPRGWLPCDGAILSIQQNQALFALLGVQYGGNGTNNFALPDLRGRVPVFGDGNVMPRAAAGGKETHTLTVNEIPQHTHQVTGSTLEANAANPTNGVWANTGGRNIYATSTNAVMNESAIGAAGADQAHSNMQPYNVFLYCIATTGLWPSRE